MEIALLAEWPVCPVVGVKASEKRLADTKARLAQAISSGIHHSVSADKGIRLSTFSPYRATFNTILLYAKPSQPAKMQRCIRCVISRHQISLQSRFLQRRASLKWDTKRLLSATMQQKSSMHKRTEYPVAIYEIKYLSNWERNATRQTMLKRKISQRGHTIRTEQGFEIGKTLS